MLHQGRRSSSGSSSSSRGRLLLMVCWRGREGRRRLRVDVIAEEVVLVGHACAELEKEEEKNERSFVFPLAS